MTNSVTIVGNLTNEPELRFLPNGTGVVSFTIAQTARKFDKANDQWVDGDTLFLRASAWRDLAEHVAESLVKGTRVLAVGKLKQRSYEKDGEKKTVYELDVEEIGPSLKNATAKVNKARGTMQGDAGPEHYKHKNRGADDTWGQKLSDDEPPF